MIYLDLEDLVHLADLAVGPSVHQKAAALLHSLVSNHALVDGNKRLGWAAAVVFLDLNGWVVDAEDDPAYDLVIGVAEGRLDVGAIASALEAWARPSDH